MQEGIFKCTNCGHQFHARQGGYMSSEEYACIDCDEIAIIKRSENITETTCTKCGARSIPGLKRMCPVCRLRDTSIIHHILIAD